MRNDFFKEYLDGIYVAFGYIFVKDYFEDKEKIAY